MPNEYDNRLITKLTIAMECFEDFHKNYEDQKDSEKILSCIRRCI